MDKFPIPLLRSISATIESARAFVSERRKDSHLHCRLREASETLNKMMQLEEKEEQPFWYSLYEGIISKYIKLKNDCHHLQFENKNLRQENAVLKEKYWDAIKRLEPTNSEVDKW